MLSRKKLFLSIALLFSNTTLMCMKRLTHDAAERKEGTGDRKTAAMYAQLFRACETDIGKLHEILQNPHIDTNITDGDRGTPLCVAITELGLHAPWKNGYQAIICLITHRADITMPTAKGDTPLHLAIKLKKKVYHVPQEVVYLINYLIAKGANVAAQNRQGKTPLHGAVALSFDAAIPVLLKRKASLHTFAQHHTPLHLALMKGSLHTAKLIIDEELKQNPLEHLGYVYCILGDMFNALNFEQASDYNQHQSRSILTAKIIYMLQHGWPLDAMGLSREVDGTELVMQHVYKPFFLAIQRGDVLEVKRRLNQKTGLHHNFYHWNNDNELRSWIRNAGFENHCTPLSLALHARTFSCDMVPLLLDRGGFTSLTSESVRRAYTHGHLEHAQLLFSYLPKSLIKRYWYHIAISLFQNRHVRHFSRDLRNLLAFYCIQEACIQDNLTRCKELFAIRTLVHDHNRAYYVRKEITPLESNDPHRNKQYQHDYDHLLDNIPVWQKNIYEAIMQHNVKKA
ncbi:MAG: ankyrin repeat domain-containing protein [Candidatus Babeliales bacterium]